MCGVFKVNKQARAHRVVHGRWQREKPRCVKPNCGSTKQVIGKSTMVCAKCGSLMARPKQGAK